MGVATLSLDSDAVECVGQCEGVVSLHSIGQVAVVVVALGLLKQILNVLPLDVLGEDGSVCFHVDECHLHPLAVVLHGDFVGSLSDLVHEVKCSVGIPLWIVLECSDHALSTKLNGVDVRLDDIDVSNGVLWLCSPYRLGVFALIQHNAVEAGFLSPLSV